MKGTRSIHAVGFKRAVSLLTRLKSFNSIITMGIRELGNRYLEQIYVLRSKSDKRKRKERKKSTRQSLRSNINCITIKYPSTLEREVWIIRENDEHKLVIYPRMQRQFCKVDHHAMRSQTRKHFH